MIVRSPPPDPGWLNLGSIGNFRDVGGYATIDGQRVRSGRVYRSGHLADASEGDLAELARLGVRRVIDLRGRSDVDTEGPDRLPAGADLVSIAMEGTVDTGAAEVTDIRQVLESQDAVAISGLFGDGQAAELMVQAAATMVTNPDRCQQYGRVLRTLGDPAGLPTVIHCSAGKDRTGWTASLLLLLLGVDERDVISEYLASNAHQATEWATRRTALSAAGIDPSLLEPLFFVRAEYLQASLDAVDKSWGGVDRYLRDGLSVTDDLIERLRDALIEPAVDDAGPPRQ